MNIRRVTTTDIALLQKIASQTFYESFASVNTKEDMEAYLSEKMSAAVLAAELDDNDAAFYFAETDNQVLGYLKINTGKAQTEQQDENALEIERIYVLKAFQGKNIGQLLYQKAIDIATERKASYVWLGVWEENHGAIRFYRRNGFEAFGQHLFTLGKDVQTDILMKKNIQEA